MSSDDFGQGMFESAPAAKRSKTATKPSSVHQIMDLGEAPAQTFSDHAEEEDSFLFGGQPTTPPVSRKPKRNSLAGSQDTVNTELDDILTPSAPTYNDDFDFEGGAAQIVAKSQSKTKRKRSALLALSLVVAVLATVFVTNGLVNGKPEVLPVSTEDSWFSKVEQAQESSDSLPLSGGFTQWSINPSGNSTYSVFGAGIVGVVEGSLLTYDLAGKQSEKVKLKAPVSYTLETVDGRGNPAVAWKSAEQLGIWSPADGVTTFKIQNDSEVSANGTGLLVHQKDGTALAALPGAKELKKLPASSEGYQLAALDEGKLLSINSAKRSVKLTDITGQSPQSIHLKAPVAGATLTKVVGAGHGVVAALWAAGPDDRLSTLGVHPLDGEKASYLPIETDKAQGMQWTVGQGMQLATYGPYAIELSSATAVISTDAQNIVMTGALGELPYVEDQSGDRRFIVDGKLYSSGDKQLMGVTSDGAVIIRLPDGTIESYTDGKV